MLDVTGAFAGDPGFVGRAGQLAAISACAAQVALGRPWVVWIDGPAGAGKSALLRQAVAALPPGFGVLRAEAGEVAADIPFDLVSQLGEVTATALFPAAMQLLGVWGAATRGGPVAVAVEDLHWADAESRMVLLAAVRRLREDRVLVLVTSRPEPGDADGWDRLRADPDRCLDLPLGSLPAGEVAELAARRGVSLTAAAAARLVRHTGGHALYVRTLLAEVPPAVLAAAGGELPVPRSLASTTLARLAGLSPDGRRLAAALAVLNQPAPLQQLARVAGVDGAARAADGLLGTGFVTWREAGPGVLEFAHPLYRAALYADMAPSLRQELHLRSAEVTGGAAALGHRVAAADSADDELAAELEEAARAEAAAGHLGRAASYLLWASQLSSSWEQAEGQLLDAARLRLAAGQSAQVESLRARLEACSAQPLRSLVLGVLAWEQGDAAAAEQLLREAAAGPGPQAVPRDGLAGSVTGDALAQLSVLFVTQVRGREGAAAAARALEQPHAAPDVEPTASLALAFSQAMLHGGPAGLECITRRLPQPAADVPAADVDLLITRGALQMYAGHPHAAVADLRAALRLARHAPSLYLPRAHLHLGQSLFFTGDWDEALVHGRVALSFGSGERHTWLDGQAHAAVVYVLAARGDWAGAGEHLAEARRIAGDGGTTEGLVFSLIARAYLAAAHGEPARVIEALTPLADSEEQGMTKVSMLEWWPLLVTALIQTGALAGAARHIDALTAVAAGRRLNLDARTAGLRARLSAAAGRPDEAMAAFGRALDLLGPDDPALDAAVLHHDFGLFLLARKQRRDGTAQLMLARQMLAGQGAVPYLERMDADLSQAGIRSPAPAGGAAMALTEREADVVALVSKGMTNAEVAAELYVSVNTVEYHLRNVFAKLGVRSRRELRGRPGRNA